MYVNYELSIITNYELITKTLTPVIEVVKENRDIKKHKAAASL